MRTTINLDDDLLRQAQDLTQITEKTELVHLGLRALIARTAAQRLARLGGKLPKAKAPPRRKAAR